MPLPKNKTVVEKNKALFIALVLFVGIVWFLYRSLFVFPVWFDEIVGKAIFFGLPVWIFITISRFNALAETVHMSRFRAGVLQGIAFGGIFGFAAALASLVLRDASVIPVPLFESGAFWTEFALALFTGFWESLFFYGFIMSVLLYGWSHWPLIKHIFVSAVIFTVFHIPILFVQTQAFTSILGYVFLLFAFGIGQAFLFARNRNLYTLIVVHAIWGMTLLIHTL